MTSLPEKWFANRGQIIQALLAASSLAFTIANNPKVFQRDYFSAGALAFYAIAALVIVDLWMFFRPAKTVPLAPSKPSGVQGPTLEMQVLGRLYVLWSCLADDYEGLDYDNRMNHSTRYPFNTNSWPDYDQPWSYVHARLHSNYVVTKKLLGESRALSKFVALPENFLPSMAETAVMVDFIRQARELQRFLEAKLAALGSQRLP